MNFSTVQTALEDYPIICAVKNEEGLKTCMECEGKIVFVLFGTLITISAITARLKEAGKIVFVHMDLIEGLAAKEAAVDYIAQCTSADGIISIKPHLIRHGRRLGLLTVQRVFVLDSLSLNSLACRDTYKYADLVEILPGLVPKVLRRVKDKVTCPIVAGGLIQEKEDVIEVLSAGAVAVSSTSTGVWFL